MDAKERIIVALDVDKLSEASYLIESLSPFVGYFKVGLQLITSEGAPQVIRHIHQYGAKVFFDGKFADIPNTVGEASAAVTELGVEMFNVHASSGMDSMRKAVANKGKSICLAVTVLTAIDDAECVRLLGGDVQTKVTQYAMEAASAGIDGLVCSALDLQFLNSLPSVRPLLKVTPGVRPSWADKGDQKRVATPAEAIKLGATHLVIGRPITAPPKSIGRPPEAAKRILDEIRKVTHDG